jgi:hypothetical protein
MKNALIFAAGFGAGWLTRSTFGSSKSATVQILAFTLDAVARFKRALAIEREQLEDIMAEAQDAALRRRAEHLHEEPSESAPADQAA